jgi:hypothetical protein
MQSDSEEIPTGTHLLLRPPNQLTITQPGGF